ncbi:hypothetical protein V9T40_014663 [Parthenolecanium corni]|uniref:Amine oxidase domain-containing protein n=1 Tax=Parthenolecanium corni TaxID=536013 RepID=A0AAN9TGX2_9HEMI
MAAKDVDSPKKYRVVILGAGIAGLSAAKHFVKNNMMDFLLLEAKDIIGGRICSVERENMKFEIGANWIHGVLGNPLYEIAIAHGLVDIISTSKPHKVVAATEDGKQVPFSVLQEIYGAYMCFLHRCEEYFLCQYLPPDGIHSVGEHINLEIELYLNRISDSSQRKVRRLLFQCLLKRETCISGCDSMNDIDLLELGSYTELQGGNIVLPSGYSSILGPVSQGIPKVSILLNHRVTEVRWHGMDYYDKSDSTSINESGNESDDSGKTVVNISESKSKASTSNTLNVPGTIDPNESGVEIFCENGKTFKADSAICALPLGVLKDNISKMFVPPLPDYKVESVEHLLFGTVDKIFLGYDRPFLNADVSEVLLLWENDCDSTKTAQDDLSDSWYKKIYSFSKVNETLLLGWVSGKEAMYMETLPDDVIADTCTKVLRKFLNDPYVPKPKFIFCTRWHSDRDIRGSYTAIAVGSSQVDIECVAQPLYSKRNANEPVLLFAGEHTHNNFYSTVHGAYLSGRMAAQQILEADRESEIVLECDSTSDLSSWIRGISLEEG